MPKLRTVEFELKTEIDETFLLTLNEVETEIVKSTLDLLNSTEMETIKLAYLTNQDNEVSFFNFKVLYVNEPCNDSYFGFSLFKENGFILFCKAFSSKKELIRTILHELYRLKNSDLSTGIPCSRELAKTETFNANEFSERIFKYIFNEVEYGKIQSK